jgi:hypothetical protein
MEFLIAFGGGAGGYSTRGIPAAWLVGADGKIVWKGHPAELRKELLEENLKNVRLRPKFEFQSDALKKVSKHVDAGDYGKAIAELDKVIAKSEDAAVVDQARSAHEQIIKFGEEELQAVETLATSGWYVLAMQKLNTISDGFKGTPIGDRADEKETAWKKDPKVKIELEGAEAIAKAKDLIAKYKKKDAARVLVAVAKGEKFKETKAQKDAEALLAEISGSL